MRVLLTGANGVLGSYLLRELRQRGGDVTAWAGRAAVPLTEPAAVTAAFRAARPTVVLHAAALARVADCYQDRALAQRVNVLATGHLAELAHQAGARLVYVSTDLVFDGRRGGYREDDARNPLSVYGRTKAAAELVVGCYPRGLVARVSLLFGPGLGGAPTFFDTMIQALRAGQPCRLFVDEWRTPLDLGTAAAALADLTAADVTGTLHLAGPERLSRFEMGLRLAEHLRCDPAALVPVRREDVPAQEPRPRDTSLDVARWRALFPDRPWPRFTEALAALPGAAGA